MTGTKVTITDDDDATLTAGSITQTAATLTLADRTGTWWLKRTAPTAGSCESQGSSSYTEDLTTLTPATSYTYRAYRDSDCTDSIDSATFKTSLPTVTLSVPSGSISEDGGTKTVTATLSNAAAAAIAVAITDSTLYTGESQKTITAGDTTTTWTITAVNNTAHNDDVTAAIAGTATLGNTPLTVTGTAVTITDDSDEATLSAGSIGEVAATLTLADRTGDWWVKKTSPTPAGSCKSKGADYTEGLTGLTPATAYTYRAYSASGCASAAELDDVSFTTGKPTITLSVNNNAILEDGGSTTVTATLSNAAAAAVTVSPSSDSRYTSTTPAGITAGQTTTTWTLTPVDNAKDNDDASAPVAATATLSNTSLTVTGTKVTITDDDDATLTAGSITQTAATLTLADRTGTWYLRRTAPTPAGSCKSKGSTYTEGLTGLTPAESYTYKGYRDSDCTDLLDSATFSTAQPTITFTVNKASFSENGGTATVTATLSNAAAAAVTVTLTDSTHYTGESQKTITAGDTTATWTITAVNNSKANDDVSAAVTGTASLGGSALTVTGTTITITDDDDTSVSLGASSVGETSATLTLANRSGNWWLKRTAPTPAGSCESQGTDYTEDLTGLTPATSYTYTAYSTTACPSADELGDATFTTDRPAITLSVNNNTISENGGTATVTATLSNAAAAAVTVTLTDSTHYTGESQKTITAGDTTATWTITAVDNNNNNNDLTAAVTGTASLGGSALTVTGTTITITDDDSVSLRATTIGQTSATLTLANRSGNWWLKRTAPHPGGLLRVTGQHLHRGPHQPHPRRILHLQGLQHDRLPQRRPDRQRDVHHRPARTDAGGQSDEHLRERRHRHRDRHPQQRRRSRHRRHPHRQHPLHPRRRRIADEGHHRRRHRSRLGNQRRRQQLPQQHRQRIGHRNRSHQHKQPISDSDRRHADHHQRRRRSQPHGPHGPHDTVDRGSPPSSPQFACFFRPLSRWTTSSTTTPNS